eukprot:TRINITY_DN49307_c0_g1_i2.p1 TRINITY_DN49307_c0_g1~~TRINITY_DN49307_c0_g1_i2.p1  ORF type:complete len:546 (-),score=108.50 TRINITY_DN49307_c0_g1_i2:112-1749(-)
MSGWLREIASDFDRRGEDLQPIGRLDKDTSGLLLAAPRKFVGIMNHAICSPGRCRKTYICCLDRLPEHTISKLRKGVELEEGVMKPLRAEVLNGRRIPAAARQLAAERYPKVSQWTFVLLEIDVGWFHVVRRVMKAVGAPVLHLHRHAIANVCLDDLGLTEPRTCVSLPDDVLDALVGRDSGKRTWQAKQPDCGTARDDDEASTGQVAVKDEMREKQVKKHNKCPQAPTAVRGAAEEISRKDDAKEAIVAMKRSVRRTAKAEREKEAEMRNSRLDSLDKNGSESASTDDQATMTPEGESWLEDEWDDEEEERSYSSGQRSRGASGSSSSSCPAKKWDNESYYFRPKGNRMWQLCLDGLRLTDEQAVDFAHNVLRPWLQSSSQPVRFAGVLLDCNPQLGTRGIGAILKELKSPRFVERVERVKFHKSGADDSTMIRYAEWLRSLKDSERWPFEVHFSHSYVTAAGISALLSVVGEWAQCQGKGWKPLWVQMAHNYVSPDYVRGLLDKSEVCLARDRWSCGPTGRCCCKRHPPLVHLSGGFHQECDG